MTEINYGLQQMYEIDMRNVRERRKNKEKQANIITIIFAASILAISGLMMPSPANWYVWILGGAGIMLFRKFLL